MALYSINVKRSAVINGVRLEKGMSVEVASAYSDPISTNSGKEVQAAFERKYGIDIRKACALNRGMLELEKMQ